MKLPVKVMAAVVAFSTLAGGAQAWEGKTIACYDKVLMSAKYKITKELVKPAKRQYEYHHGVYKLVEYPPVYKENREVIEPEHYVLRETACKK